MSAYDLLSSHIGCWRAERPSEWIMDEFILKAKKLEADYAALKEENERYAIALTEICNWHVIPSSVGGHAALALIQRAKDALGYDYDYKRFLAYIKEKNDEINALEARVAELEKERQTLADAAYSAIIAFNNLQDESLDGEARAQALLKHTDCIRNLWNTFATQDNARFKEPANEG